MTRIVPAGDGAGRKVYWTLRYRLNGLDREMSLGGYPAVSLADARFKQMELRALVAKGQDPVGKAQERQSAGPDAERRSHLRPLRRPVYRPARRRLENASITAMGCDAEDLRRADP